MMLSKKIAEPEETAQEGQDGGHSESIAVPEEVATDSTAALGSTEFEEHQQNAESQSKSEICNGEGVQDHDAQSKAEEGQEGAIDEELGLEEPLLPNGHQVGHSIPEGLPMRYKAMFQDHSSVQAMHV